MGIFNTDKLRQNLAKEAKIAELSRTYDGSFPDIPSMNNPRKWDFRAISSNRMISGKASPQTMKRLGIVLSLIDSFKSVLDFGVGPADILSLLIKRNKNVDYTGIDISNDFILRLKKEYPSQKFECRDLSSVESESYDQILALEVFEHIDVPNLKNVYLHLWRILKKDGHLIISVPINEKLEDFTIYCSKCGNVENVPGHVRAFNRELVCSELELGGFQVKKYRLIWQVNRSPLKNMFKVFYRIFFKEMPVTIVIKAKKISTKKNLYPDYKTH